MMKNLPVRVILAESAYQVIASESAVSLEVETGGLLVGRRVYYRDSPLVVVLYASGPGRAADQQTLQFSPDHKALQAELERWRDRFSQYDVDYVGEWHKHPPELPYPSRGDVRQARRILADSSYNLPEGYLLLPISRIDADTLELDVYLVSRDLGGYLPVPYDRMPLDALCKSLDEVLSANAPNHLEPEKPVKHGRTFPDRLSSAYAQKPSFPEDRARAFTVHDYDPGKTIEGRVIKREEQKEAGRAEPGESAESTESGSHSGVDPFILRLSREVERIRRLGKRYGFQVQASPDYELLRLTLENPILLPLDAKTSPGNLSPESHPAEGESFAAQSPEPEATRQASPGTMPTLAPARLVKGEPDSTPTIELKHRPDSERDSAPLLDPEPLTDADADSTSVPVLEHSSGMGFDSIPSPALQQPSDTESESAPAAAVEHSLTAGLDSSPPPSRELLHQILVFLGYYPERIQFWLQTDLRARPVPPAIQPRRARSATVEQMVEDILRNLTDDLKPDGPLAQMFSDLEYHTRKAIHIGAATVQSVNELVTRLEAEFNQGYDFSTELRIRPQRNQDVRNNTG